MAAVPASCTDEGGIRGPAGGEAGSARRCAADDRASQPHGVWRQYENAATTAKPATPQPMMRCQVMTPVKKTNVLAEANPGQDMNQQDQLERPIVTCRSSRQCRKT